MKLEKTPKISVIMSVYNSDRFLKDSIDSILRQTFSDFEFIITDDKSSDSSLSVLEEYAKKDGRIVLLKNLENMGLTKNLNGMIRIAKGKYIARLDADDISLPERLWLQHDFMENHPETGVLGTDGKIFGDNRKTITINRPETNEEIRAAFLFENLLIHSSAFIRKSVLDEHNIGYDENFRIIQDLELWTRMTAVTGFHILPQALTLYRVSDTNISTTTERKDNYRESVLKDIYATYLSANNFKFSRDQADIHVIMLHKRKITDKNITSKIEEWLLHLQSENIRTKSFDESYFRYMISKHWYKSCTRSTSLGAELIYRYFRSELHKGYNPGFIILIRFILKCLIRY
ncbi:MAG: glycosyltransferase [Candidatus Delongbacteria bacterium]|nr:glycosyltransferase [Candidatus Delongbacteria bacterium]